MANFVFDDHVAVVHVVAGLGFVRTPPGLFSDPSLGLLRRLDRVQRRRRRRRRARRALTVIQRWNPTIPRWFADGDHVAEGRRWREIVRAAR